MMKNSLFFSMVFVILLVWTRPTLADTDYQCLKACVANGKSASSCMSTCSYVTPVKPSSDITAAPSPQLSNHRILNTPVDMGDAIKLDPPAPHIDKPATDYKCMSQCLHLSKVYASCEYQCTPKPGAVTTAGHGVYTPFSNSSAANLAVPVAAAHPKAQ